MIKCSSRNACSRLLACMLLVGLSFLFNLQSFAGNISDSRFASKAFDKIVKGRVTDASTGNALVGASIGIKGTSTNVLSDASGNYSITVSNDNAVLTVSFVGYSSTTVIVGNRTSIDVALQSAASDLAQIVVVGYGTQSKKDVTGAVKSVKAESFNKGIINAPQQLLQGKVAGVNVTSASGEPGAIQGISIRGPGGVRTGSTPLFVVDGLP